MPDNDSAQAQVSEPFTTDLLLNSQMRFGELLYELCEVSGFTQGKLSREAKDEYRQLKEQGVIRPNYPISSMEQPTISKVIAGVQAPTYLQVYIWLRVLRAHFESTEFIEICKELKIDLPKKFSLALEKELWRLSTFVPPDELGEVYKNTQDIELIKFYPSLIEHKERRWDKARKRPANKSAKMGMKKTPPPHDVAVASMRNNS